MKIIVYGLGAVGQAFLNGTKDLFKDQNSHIELLAVSDSDSAKNGGGRI